MADKEEQKVEDLFGLTKDDAEASSESEHENDETDDRFSKRRLFKTKDVLSLAQTGDSSEDEDDSDDENKSEFNKSASEDERDIDAAASDGDDHPSDGNPRLDETNAEIGDQTSEPKKKKKKTKKLTREELEKYQQEEKNSGVCYLSRIPPFMTPQQVKRLLSQYTEIGRVFFETEDERSARRRKKYTRERRTRFTEGWVEFKSKVKAKRLAEFLNMRQIGGKRKSPFYYDTWTIKYLPKFKWRHLTEQIAYERKAREQQLMAEMAQAKREDKAYVESVARSKMHKSMEEKKRSRGQEADESNKIRRTFAQREKKQREVTDDVDAGKKALERMDGQMKKVLSNIFSK
ncbi:hypothetical protein BX666DRAFT_1947096 [Dichotomocladium elegans]|nr:hypothetical protein BX666DRAFT_1947096 [Dichotomocladium elegans]